MVVMINLSDTDDPYLIFESLNFKGSPPGAVGPRAELFPNAIPRFGSTGRI